MFHFYIVKRNRCFYKSFDFKTLIILWIIDQKLQKNDLFSKKNNKKSICDTFWSIIQKILICKKKVVPNLVSLDDFRQILEF